MLTAGENDFDGFEELESRVCERDRQAAQM